MRLVAPRGVENVTRRDPLGVLLLRLVGRCGLVWLSHEGGWKSGRSGHGVVELGAMEPPRVLGIGVGPTGVGECEKTLFWSCASGIRRPGTLATSNVHVSRWDDRRLGPCLPVGVALDLILHKTVVVSWYLVGVWLHLATLQVSKLHEIYSF
jgi:hypothetical protein